MPKINVTLDNDVRDALIALIPPRKRSQVINQALRNELLRRKRELATSRLREFRLKSASLTAREVMDAVRGERAKRG